MSTSTILSMEKLPPLPDNLGFAGMYAGVSNGSVFYMGGANFPDKKPWEGGKKIWSRKIFMFNGYAWSILKQELPFPIAYGVSVSYENKIILIGGNNDFEYSNKVVACKWHNQKIHFENYPDLPFPLANMCGTIAGDLLIITGGNSSEVSGASKSCIALDFKSLEKGWLELDPWPGLERVVPVCTAYQGKYYMFSGETTLLNKFAERTRYILHDSYCFTPDRKNPRLGSWEKLSDLPRGFSAGPSPLPVIKDLGFIFWGGVDAVTALHENPSTHPGICRQKVAYNPESDTWIYIQGTDDAPARVTMPVVNWKDKWLYASGEIKPGLRTNTVYSIF